MASSKVINNATESLITRSQATELVDFYNKSCYSVDKFTDMCKQSDIGDNLPLKAINETITQLYMAIHHLKTYVYIRDLPNIKDYNDLNITLPPGKNTVKMLHYAVDNYLYIRDNREYAVEDMTDCFIEETTCAICQLLRVGEFYFSTMYGLNAPICNVCIVASDYQSADETKKDVNYIASEEEEESEEDESDEDESDEDGVEASETDEDPLDEDYSESEEEESDEEESDEDGVEGEDPLGETDKDPLDEDGVEASETDKNPLDEEEAETLYLNGWEDGWEAAMKNIAKKAKNTEVKFPARCNNCKTCMHLLKRCAGSCGGVARYCSAACQKNHWYDFHRDDCHKL